MLLNERNGNRDWNFNSALTLIAALSWNQLNPWCFHLRCWSPRFHCLMLDFFRSWGRMSTKCPFYHNGRLSLVPFDPHRVYGTEKSFTSSKQSKHHDLHPKWLHRDTNDNIVIVFTTMIRVALTFFPIHSHSRDFSVLTQTSPWKKNLWAKMKFHVTLLRVTSHAQCCVWFQMRGKDMWKAS